MAMTPAEIKDMFEEIIDDSVSDETAYVMMENADEELRSERDWYFLREATTIARVAADVYTTAHALPSTFDRVRLKEDAVRSDGRTYSPIDMDQREEYKDSDGFYYLKYNTATELWEIYFTGSGVSETVNVAFQKKDTEISDARADTAVLWPGKRGAILAWQMAYRVANGIDGDEINFRMSEGQMSTYQEMLKGLRSWNSKTVIRAMGGTAGFRQPPNYRSSGRIDKYGGVNQ
jgi:hypothetical protein